MTVIRMPQAGRGATGATITRWFKSEGESFAQGEALFAFEIEEGPGIAEAPAGATLRRILSGTPCTVGFGAPVAIAAGPGEDISVEVAMALEETNANQIDREVPDVTANQPSKSASSPATNGRRGEVIPILMPQAGNTMEEGTVLSWKVKPGDRVGEGDILMEIETDKATMEVEATDAGRVARLVAKEGDIVPVKAPVGYLAEDDADVDAYLSEQGEAVGANEPAQGARTPSSAPTAPSESVIPVLMPQAGNTMEEGTILSWKVKPGDRVGVGDILMEIETDKASMEVEATDAGRVARLVAKEGDIVPVKQAVAYMAENDADVEAFIASEGGVPEASAAKAPPAASSSAPAAPVQAPAAAVPAAPLTGRVKASPYARKVAARAGVDIARVGAGSGPGGRILSTDVERAAQSETAATQPATEPIHVEPASVVLGQPQRQALSKMRRAIASNLQTSKQTVPHWYLKLTIDADPLMTFYRAQKLRFALTLNDIVTYAVSKAVTELPAFRSRIDGSELVTIPNANIGLAVGTDEGLVVPVVCGIDQMTLPQLALESRRIVEAARAGKIEGIGKGVFTISNMGMTGVEEFSAIINPPESGILAVGAVREDVVVRGGMLRPGRVMSMTLSSDHRVVDGLVGARFASQLKELLESPEGLL